MGSACRSRAGGLSDGRGRDTTLPGSSGLSWNAFSEIWPIGHLQFYICRLGGGLAYRPAEDRVWTAGRARGWTG